jgi:gas vesicle protein
MNYNEIQEMIDSSIDQLKSEMQDEINTVNQRVDDLQTDLESAIQELDI